MYDHFFCSVIREFIVELTGVFVCTLCVTVMFVTDDLSVPSIIFICIGSSSPYNSDDEQKMNNFIEKGIVSLF